jgi:hypothetical protein
MENIQLASSLMDGDFVISDKEIDRLAKLGENTNGTIEEFKNKDSYTMLLKYNIDNDDFEEILVSSADKNTYLSNSKRILQTFAKRKILDLGTIFGKKIYKL